MTHVQITDYRLHDHVALVWRRYVVAYGSGQA